MFRYIGLGLILTILPSAYAQAAVRTPDPSQVALSQQDLNGWTQTEAIRDEQWQLSNVSNAPNGPSDAYHSRPTLRTTCLTAATCR